MSNTSKISIKYYNRDTPEDYEYTLNDTVQSFLAKHPNIGDVPIEMIFVGIYMYLEDSLQLMHTVVNNMVPGEPILAFPSAVSLNFTYTNIYKDQRSETIHFNPKSSQDVFMAQVCKVFDIKGNTKWKMNSKDKSEFPKSFRLFDFSSIDYTIEQVCSNDEVSI